MTQWGIHMKTMGGNLININYYWYIFGVKITFFDVSIFYKNWCITNFCQKMETSKNIILTPRMYQTWLIFTHTFMFFGLFTNAMRYPLIISGWGLAVAVNVGQKNPYAPQLHATTTLNPWNAQIHYPSGVIYNSL